MTWYRNKKPSILGLSYKGDSPTLVQPGAVFEADKADIPQSYFDNGFIEEAEAPKKDAEGDKVEKALALGTSINSPAVGQDIGITDKVALESKAYEYGKSPAERADERDKEQAAEADKHSGSKKHK